MLHANKRMTVDRFTNNTWIEDTGASYHVTNLADNMFENTDINKQVKVGNGKNMTATKNGKWRGIVDQKDGTEKNYT